MTIDNERPGTRDDDEPMVSDGPFGAGPRDRGRRHEAAIEPAGDSVDDSIVAAFESELAEARRLADENWDRYLRAEADLDNLRRRSRRQSDEALRHQRREMLTRFLAVADNLELALSHSDADPATVVSGIDGTYRELKRLLDQEGVTPIEAMDARFDPSLHEAIAVVPMPGADEVIVVSVERTGYAMDGETLRPARVIVGKPMEPSNNAGDD